MSVVAKLFYSEASHVTIKPWYQGLEWTHFSLCPSVGLQFTGNKFQHNLDVYL